MFLNNPTNNGITTLFAKKKSLMKIWMVSGEHFAECRTERFVCLLRMKSFFIQFSGLGGVLSSDYCYLNSTFSFRHLGSKYRISFISKAKGQIWRGKCALMRKIWHILYTPHPDMWWPFFNSASAKKLAQVVNYQVQHPKKRWCWGDLGSSLLNGNEKPNQKWHFFLWSMMISDDFIAVFSNFC